MQPLEVLSELLRFSHHVVVSGVAGRSPLLVGPRTHAQSLLKLQGEDGMGAAECVKTVGVPTRCIFRGGLRGGRRTFSAVRLKAPISMRLAPNGS